MKLLTALTAFLAVAALMTGSASAEPDYSSNSTNSTLAGADILHSLQWTDASGLSGYIFGFCNGSWDGTDCGSGTDIELKEYYNTDDDTQGAIYNNAWWGQTFNTSADYDIKKVGVKVFKVGNPGDVSISIYPTNATGYPDATGTPLVTGTFNGNVITTSSPGEWANTTFSSTYTITAGTTYAITMNLTGDVSNYMDWRLDATGATYAGGMRGSSTDGGTTWTMNANYDMMFETYSESGTNWVNDSWVSMTGTTNWSNVTKSVNATTGANIAWKVYANDTSDNWNTSTTYSYLTTSAPSPSAGVVTIEPGVIFDPASSNTNYTFYSQYNVTSISVNSTHIEIDGAMLKAEPDTGTVNCTIYEYGTTGTHYRAFNITNTSIPDKVWCYQETATTATACGGLNTGSYVFDNYYFYINYTVPSTMVNVLWLVKHGASTNASYNISLPDNCRNQRPLQLRIKSDQLGNNYANSHPECYTGSAWSSIGNTYSMGGGYPHNAIGGNIGTTNLWDGNWNTYEVFLNNANWRILSSEGTDAGGNPTDSPAHIYEEAIWWELQPDITVTITQGGYTLDDSLLIWRNKVRDGIAQLANATGFFSITQSLSTYNITSYLGTTEPIITAYKLFTYGVFHNMTQLRDIYANITFYDTTPADTFYINTTWYKTNASGYEWCYQETANVSTACGGLATGTYSHSGNWETIPGYNYGKVIDGNIATYSYSTSGTAYANAQYVKPTYSIDGSKWGIRDRGTVTNLTIPSDCWDYSNTHLYLKTIQNYISPAAQSSEWLCYNGTWKSLRFYLGNSLMYEEAMWWRMYGTPNTYALDCCDTSNQTALNDTETTITIPCYSNQTTVADNITAQMTVVDSAGNTNTTNATGTIKSHWWDDYWDRQENW